VLAKLLASFLAGFLLSVGAGCEGRSSPTTQIVDASGPRELTVRVPGAVAIARSIDALSVAIDPASLADTKVTADPGMTLGIEMELFVFPVGKERPAQGRHGLKSGDDFDVGTSTWNAKSDGIPASGTTYLVEMQLVLFETDVPPQHEWAPHSGRYKILWSRTIRQAEE